MTTKKQAPKKAPRGLGEIRKELTPDDCTNTRGILLMFKRICGQNPDAVKAAFGPYLTKRIAEEAESGSRMVQFYADSAEYLAELFDYR